MGDKEIVDFEDLENAEDEEDLSDKEKKKRLKSEKRKKRAEKRQVVKKKFILFLKVVFTLLIVSLTGFLVSCSFVFLGFTKLAMLIVIPALFILIGLFVPLIWVKENDRGFFFMLWLLCSLLFVVGLFLPTLVFEWNTITLGINSLMSLFWGLII